MCVHIKPSNAVNELKCIHILCKQIKNKWKIYFNNNLIDYILHPLFILFTKRQKNIGPIIIGDLNCQEPYVTLKDKENVEIFYSDKFVHLINEENNTMVKKNVNFTNRAYDRIIIEKKLKSYFYKPYVFRYDKLYNLTKKETLLISNHYPIEITFKINVYRNKIINILNKSIKTSFMVGICFVFIKKINIKRFTNLINLTFLI